MQSISRRAALSTTGHAAVALLAGGGFSVAATDPNIDAALFRKEAELKAAIARREELAAIADRFSDEGERLWPRPECPHDQDEETMPDAAFAAAGEIKIKDWGKFDQLPTDNPYRVWQHEQKAAREARQATWEAWRAECDRWREESGHDAAHAEWEAQLDAIQALTDDILKLPAKTLAGIMVKLRLQSDPSDEEEMAGLLTSIEKDLRAMAGEPPRET